MQTFLPSRNFARSALVLDNKRLGKQRVETLQIMNALMLGKGWVNHPATLMWKGYEAALLGYQAAVCHEWVSRGFKDTCWLKTVDVFQNHSSIDSAYLVPPWLGNVKLHRSHRSNLLRKDPIHYGQFGWSEPHDLEYFWPVRK